MSLDGLQTTALCPGKFIDGIGTAGDHRQIFEIGQPGAGGFRAIFQFHLLLSYQQILRLQRGHKALLDPGIDVGSGAIEAGF